MQHLVVNDVLDCHARHPRFVKNSAHNDRIVRRIVMTQAMAGHIAAPRYPGSRQQAMKKSDIQVVENRFQIINSAPRQSDSLSSPEVPQEMGFLRDIMARYVSVVSG